MKILRHNFPFLGIFSRTKYCDIFLTTPDGSADGRVVPAHRVVLAAVSDKFRRFCDVAEKGKKSIVIRNLQFMVLEKIVDFVYAGRVEIEESVEFVDFKDGLDMLRVKFKEATVEGVERDECVDNRSIDTPGNEFENNSIPLKSVENQTLENDLNISFDSSKLEESHHVPVKTQPNSNAKKMTHVGDLRNISSNSSNEEETSDCDSNSVLFYNSSSDSSESDDDTKVCSGGARGAPVVQKFSNPFFELDSTTSDPEGVNEIVQSSAGQEFNNNISGIVHLNQEKPSISKVKCVHCEKVLCFKSYLNHCKLRHPEANLKKKLCNICHKGIATCSFDFHKIVFHSSDKGVKVSGDLKEKDVKQVKKTEPNKMTCSKCGKLISKLNLQRHMKYVHRKGKVEQMDKDGKQSSGLPAEIKLRWSGRIFTSYSPNKSPIYRTAKKLSIKLGLPVKLLQFKHKGKVLKGDEKASEFNKEVIEVTKKE